jgi:hypothetical protein
MATAQEIMRLVALRTGFNYEHVKQIGQNLIRSGAWDEEPQAVVYLLLALLAGAKPDSATSVARHYYNLQRVDEHGTTTTAGQMIGDMISTFLEQARAPFSAYAYQSRIEVYTGTPVVRITTPCSNGPLALTYLEGHDSETWSHTTVRRGTILPGEGLFNISADILMLPSQRRVSVPHRVVA